MIRVIRNYSDIPSEDQLLKMMGDQMSHIGSSADIERLKSALKNALKAESRVRLFLSISEDEELQGFAFANICSGLESGADYLWINELHIDKEFRQKGVAEELLEFIEKWAVEKNMPYMACITSSLNAPAQTLYKKKGFSISETLWVDKTMRVRKPTPDIKTLNIRPLSPTEQAPMELLLNADPSEKLVKDYLTRGLCLIAELQNEIAGALILMPKENKTMEIMNVSVTEKLQNLGIGKALIHKAVEEAGKTGAKVLEIGTGNPGFGQLYLYQKCGFRISAVDQDFFRRNYSERIYENGLECRDMIRLSMELK